MSRRVLIPVIFLLLLVGVGAGAWWYMAIGRFPLSGDTHHDFGEVSLHGETEVTHVFHLRNRTSEPVVIERTKTNCGCTLVELSDTVVPPGGELEVRAALGLTTIGAKRTNAVLFITGYDPMTLWLRATGVKAAHLVPTIDRVTLSDDGPTRVTFLLDMRNVEVAPSPPLVTAAPWLTATFVGWERIDEGRPDGTRPARWRGTVDVTRAASDQPPPARSALLMEIGAESASVTIIDARRGSDTPTEAAPVAPGGPVESGGAGG